MEDISGRNIKALPDHKAVIDKTVSEIAISERTLASWKRKITKWYELYKMVQRHRHYEGLAKIFVPEILRAVETITANLYKIIVNQTPWFEFKGREKTDSDSARAMTELVLFQMDESNFKSKLMDSLRQMAIAGVTIRKVTWDFRQIMRKKKVSVNEESTDGITGQKSSKRKVEVKDVLETVKDTWDMSPVDLLTFHISDITIPYNDIQKARWIGEQYFVDRQWVRERVKKGWLSEAQLAELDRVGIKKPDSQASNYIEQRSTAAGFTLTNNADRQIEIIERWGLVPAPWVHNAAEMKELGLDKEDFVEAVLIIANRCAILKLEANPFWHGQKPYVACPFVPQEGELPGMGVAQISESLQEELNDTRNQTMDNKTLILSNMWVISRSAGIRSSQLKIRPQGAIFSNDVNGIVPLRPPVLTGVGVNIEAVIKEDLRQSVGAGSNLQGIAQAGVDSATEAANISRESFSRIGFVAENYGLLVLKPMLQMIELLNYQFYDQEKVIRIIGERGINYEKRKPEDIVGNQDVVISIATDMDNNPATRRQHLIQFFSILQTMAPPVVEYHWGILSLMYKSFFPHGDLSDYYKAPGKYDQKITPEQEIALILAEQPVEAKQGQDHKTHMMELEKLLEDTKMALSEKQFKYLTEAIASHQAMYEQEEMAKMQEDLNLMAQQSGELEQAGGGPNLGQTPNTSPSTISPTSTDGQTMRDARQGT